jgi:hypothetical protein
MNLIGCGTAQKWQLRLPDGLNISGRLLLNWHMASCAGCRAFARDAETVLEGTAPLASVEPDARVYRALHLRAVTEMDRTRQRVDAESRRRRRLVLVAVPSAVAGIILAMAVPGLFRSGPDTPVAIEERLASIQEELVPAAEPTITVMPKTTLDDRIREMEKQLRCLEIEIENLKWNSLEGGNQCTES